MTIDPPTRASTGERIIRVFIWIILATSLTLAVIQYSQRRGKLTLAPGFDDVGYMADGAARTDLYWESGGAALFTHLYNYPPHSPYSTFMAILAFLIFGIRDWAPYAMNGIVVVGYLALCDHLLRRLALWQKLIGYAFMLSVPLIVGGVYEFRPDHACALITVAACFVAIERPFLGANTPRLLLIGALFGLALLVKPTTLPATVVLMLGSLFLATMTDIFGRDRKLTIKSFARSWGTVFGVLAVESLPYLSVAGRQIYDYIKENVFGAHRTIWAARGTRLEHARYYLTGNGGRVWIGYHLWLLLAVMGVAGVYCLSRRNRAEIARGIALLCLLLGTFFSVVMNPVETPFFGLTFHTCTVFVAVAATGYIIAHSRFYWGTAVAAVAAIIGVYNSHWPDHFDAYASPIATSRRNVVYGTFDTVVQHKLPGRPVVLIMGIGDVNSSTMQYLAYKNQQDIDFYFVTDTGRKELNEAEWNRCDFVIASEMGTQITADFLFDYRILDDLLVDLRKRPDYRQIAYFPFIKSGKGYYVFQRVKTDVPVNAAGQ